MIRVRVWCVMVPMIVAVTMGMIVAMPMIVAMFMAVVIMIAAMMMVMAVIVMMAAAAVRAVLMDMRLAARRRLHHRLEFGIGRGVHQVAVFAAERRRWRIVEGRFEFVRLGMGMDRRPG